MKRAILFVAWGEFFVQEVLECIAESELPDCPLYLMCDLETPVPPAAGLEVIRVPFSLGGKLRKAELGAHLPEEVDSWLFLDSDTRVVGDLGLGFDKAEEHGLALALAPHCTLEAFHGFGAVMDAEGVARRGQVQFNTGVVFFRRGESVDGVLRRWHELCLRHGGREHSDQPYFTLALEQLGVRPYVLSPAFNYRGVGEWLSGSLRVWHARAPLPRGANADQGMRRLQDGAVLLASGGRPSALGVLQALVSAELVLAALLLAVLAARGETLWAWLQAPLVIAVAVMLLVPRRLQLRAGLQRMLLSVAVLVAVIVLPELALRVAGFQGPSGALIGPPRATRFARFVAHEELLWTRDPADSDVNALGLPGRELPDELPEGARRLLFLGDSCTAQGFPERAEALLPGTQAVALACQGYSSLQGLRMARLHGMALEPDVVFVAFGWNDHWLARGAPDSELKAPGPADRIAQHSRLVLLLRGLVAERPEPLEVPRVDPAQYRSNLEQLRSLFPGTPVVFITLPSSLGALGVPDYLVEAGFARDAGSVLADHRAYNEVVRELAGEGDHLLDLERAYAELDEQELGRIFRADGIHFTPAGLDRIGRDLAAFVRQQGLVE